MLCTVILAYTVSLHADLTKLRQNRVYFWIVREMLDLGKDPNWTGVRQGKQVGVHQPVCRHRRNRQTVVSTGYACAPFTPKRQYLLANQQVP